MSKPDIDRLYSAAVREHQAGRISEADRLYRQILAAQPNHAGALQLLGVVAHQWGHLDIAIDLIGRALQLQPDSPGAHGNFANALKDKGEIDRAIAEYLRTMELQPNCALTHNNLANALVAKGDREAAMELYRRALELKPDYAEALNNLGNNLRETGQLPAAVESYQRAIQLKPDFANAYNGLGLIYLKAGQRDQAAAVLRQATQINPNFVDAHHNLAIVLKDKGEIDLAIESYNRAVQINPNFAEAHHGLGSAWKDKGDLDRAIASYRRAVELSPQDPLTHSNLVYALHFHPRCSPAELFAEQQLWAQRHANPLKGPIIPNENDRDPDRRLRIGYLSPDFRVHPVGRFILPLLANHDHQRFEIFCYSALASPDEMTRLIQSRADVWREISALSHADLAEQIRSDRIDILVDLTMHMGYNRLPVFARKPAPIQVTYLAYAGTTGLDTIDYRMTDPHLDPPDSAREYYTEKSIHLPRSYWCYEAPIENLDPSPPPSAQTGFVTFGSLNNFCKVNGDVLESWRQLLLAVPDSRLILHTCAGNHRERIHREFAEQGIRPERLEFVGLTSMPEYMNLYGRIDIALDPFPYGGGTTTCDALWMGVPVVTLSGDTAVGRGGVSILSNIGVPEWIAPTGEAYIQIAADLANDPGRLSQLRSTLRARMRQSPLMDAKTFAADFELAYRRMWQNWCK